jgi:hypothetical protein
VGNAAKEYWETLKRRTEARIQHARGEITSAQLAEILGPPAPPGTSLGEVLGKAIKEAPEGTVGAMLRKSGQEILGRIQRRPKA